MSYNTKIPNNLKPFTMPKKHSIQVQSLGIPTKKDNGQYVEVLEFNNYIKIYFI